MTEEASNLFAMANTFAIISKLHVFGQEIEEIRQQKHATPRSVFVSLGH